MKKFKLIIPQEIEDYRLEHLPAFNQILEYDHSTEFQIEVLEGVTGVSKRFIRELKESMINKMYTHILLTFKDFKLPKHKKEIKVNGTTYSMVNPHKVGYGWWLDYNAIKDDHAMFAAMMYVEKGFKYAQIDEDENVINPTKDRAKVFKEHLPMIDYMASRVFFLKRLNRLQIASIQGVLIARKTVKLFQRKKHSSKSSKQLTK